MQISGGTGITPFYQLLHSVFASRGDDVTSLETRFTLLHSSPRPADLPPKQILAPLRDWAERYRRSFFLELFVDTVDPKGKSPDKLTVGRIGRQAVEKALLPRPEKETVWWRRLWTEKRTAELKEKRRLFLVCGPEPMIAAIAGPRGRNLTQGRVGGVLGELGADESQVYKL